MGGAAAAVPLEVDHHALIHQKVVLPEENRPLDAVTIIQDHTLLTTTETIEGLTAGLPPHIELLGIAVQEN